MLNGIQRKWVYLEPIFARGALPHEQARFRRVIILCLLPCCTRVLRCSIYIYALFIGRVIVMQVDDQFRQLMAGTETDPMILRFAELPQVMVSNALHIEDP